MLGEKSQIDAREHDPKVNLSSSTVQGVAGEQGESVYESCYNSKHGAH